MACRWDRHVRSRARTALPHRDGGLRPPPEGPLAAARSACTASSSRSPAPSRSPPRTPSGAVSEMLDDTEQARRVRRRERGRLLLLGRGPRAASASTPSASAARSRSSCARSRSTSSTVEELGLPAGRSPELAEEERGIILLTGTTGSGKSTTLAAMIDHMNRTMHKHIVTIEDPIEFLHRDKQLDHQPARGRPGHRVLQARAAPRAAPGPGRDPRRRDARRGDGPHRAVRGRDRPPRALDAPHRGRARDDQPHHRLLPAPPAAAGARDDRRHAEGRHLPAARAARRRQRPRRDLRDPAS